MRAAARRARAARCGRGGAPGARPLARPSLPPGTRAHPHLGIRRLLALLRPSARRGHAQQRASRLRQRALGVAAVGVGAAAEELPELRDALADWAP
jgi:hypothetical protein